MLLLHGEVNRLDVDRIPCLNGNAVAAGFHLRDLHDDLFLVLFYERGLVIGFVIGEEYGGNGAFSQILSRHRQVSFTLPDDGSTAVTSGEPCAKSNGQRSVSRAATRSANVVW